METHLSTTKFEKITLATIHALCLPSWLKGRGILALAKTIHLSTCYLTISSCFLRTPLLRLQHYSCWLCNSTFPLGYSHLHGKKLPCSPHRITNTVSFILIPLEQNSKTLLIMTVSTSTHSSLFSVLNTQQQPWQGYKLPSCCQMLWLFVWPYLIHWVAPDTFDLASSQSGFISGLPLLSWTQLKLMSDTECFKGWLGSFFLL
jgi:hypothetical protein